MAYRVWLAALTLALFMSAGCQHIPAKRGPLAASSAPATTEPVQAHAAHRATTSESPESSHDVAQTSHTRRSQDDGTTASTSTDGQSSDVHSPGFEHVWWTGDNAQPVVFEEPTPAFPLQEQGDDEFFAPQPTNVIEEPVTELQDQSRYIVDLPTVLRLAGAENWGVKLAYERICESQARLDAAEVVWLPSLNLGVGYTKHDGQIQATDGQVIDVSRNSLFVGGGAVTSDSPTAGGSGGPARLFVDLSLADAIFRPLAARQDVSTAQSSHRKVFNDTQLDASLAYYDLLAAQGLLAITVENLTDSRQLEEITQAFVAAGRASEAEVKRVRVVVDNRRQDVINAELAVQLASARLAQIIRLDPLEFGMCALLQSVETHVVPIEIIPCAAPLDALIAQGRGARAEVAEEYARVQSRAWQVQQERWRPWIPNVHVGFSGGAFGGDSGSSLNGLGGRSDVDALLVWQAQNLGLGAAAAQREQESRHRQSLLRSGQVQDIIAAEVKQAWSEVDAGRRQIDITGQTLVTAGEVYDSNIERIRGLEGLPLEAIQALDAVAQARRNHLTSVIRYNRGQFKLLWSIGQPLEHY